MGSPMNVPRHALTLTAGLLVSAAAPTIYAQAHRVAVVDLQRAVTETEDGRRALGRLKRWMGNRQSEIDEEQARVGRLKKAFDAMEDGPAKRERAEELQKAYVDLQGRFVELQREAAERESKATQPILTRMQRILAHIGQSEGYSLIVERAQGGVMWAPSSLDITDLVIQRYNLGEGAESRSGESGSGRARRPRRRRAPQPD